jgi:hypothetical protein
MSGSDVAAIMSAINSKDNGSGFGQNWIWIIGLLIVAGIFGGGFGNGFFGGRNQGPIIMPSSDNGSLTRQDLCQDMNFQSLENSVRGIQNGLCDGFYAQNTTMLNGFNSVGSAIANVGSQMQSCCLAS